MESQIWHHFSGSVGKGFRKGTVASALLDARYFSSSLYATGAFQAATLVLGLRGSESVCEDLLGALEVSSPNSVPAGFYSQKLWVLIMLALEPWAGELVCGWDSSLPRYPSQIFIHHTWVRNQPILHPHPSCQSGWMWFLSFYS